MAVLVRIAIVAVVVVVRVRVLIVVAFFVVTVVVGRESRYHANADQATFIRYTWNNANASLAFSFGRV